MGTPRSVRPPSPHVPTGLPILDTYLRALPRGLDSYAGCRAKCSLLRALLDTNDRPVEWDGVPAPVRALMTDPPLASAWIPEVHFVAVHCVLRDRSTHDSESLQELTFRANRHLTESRMYTALTKVASPSLLLRSAGFTWGIIHRGTSLQVLAEKGRATVHLRHPDHLYDDWSHESACRGFVAVLEAAGARSVEREKLESRAEMLSATLRWSLA